VTSAKLGENFVIATPCVSVQ